MRAARGTNFRENDKINMKDFVIHAHWHVNTLITDASPIEDYESAKKEVILLIELFAICNVRANSTWPSETLRVSIYTPAYVHRLTGLILTHLCIYASTCLQI